MRLYTIEVNGKEQVAVEIKEQMYTLETLGIQVSDMNDLIVRWGELEKPLREKMADVEMEKRVEESVDGTTEKSVDIFVSRTLSAGDYKVFAPIVKPMQDIVCLGVNYHEHIEETTDIIDFTKKKDAVYFSKRVNRCTAPDGIIPNYDFVDKLDYEVELGVILKADAFQVKKEDAGSYIFGYTIINDVSARDIQMKHQQWYLGKSLDGYTPMGPCIVTADEIGDAHDLNIRCFVNGEKRQDSNTGFMITSVEEAIAELSQGMTLAKGTVIATGTPGGVGLGMTPPVFLKANDVIRCEIEKIGVLENSVGER